jgi:hypothetical protein
MTLLAVTTQHIALCKASIHITLATSYGSFEQKAANYR